MKQTCHKEVVKRDAVPGRRQLIDINEASLYIGLHVDTIYHMVSQRRIPFVKVGRRTKFDVRLIDEWLEQHTVLPIHQ